MPITVNGFNGDEVINGILIELLEEAIPLPTLTIAAAQKDPLPDAPDTTSMGLADAAGSILVSTATNNTAETETVSRDYELPVKYQVGAPISIIARTIVDVNRDTAQTIDCVAQLWVPGGGLGADICTTAIQNITNAFADYTFAVNPATVNPGDALHFVLVFAADDTGGGSGEGTISASQVTMEVGVKK